jgi:hypothetical protein
MDDWVVVAPTRWKLRQAVRAVNEVLNELKVEQHPDKTFIGRVERGVDFLGYRFTGEGLVGIAARTGRRFVARMVQLYEQGADAIRIGAYVRHWSRWVRAGLVPKRETESGPAFMAKRRPGGSGRNGVGLRSFAATVAVADHPQ